MSTSTSSSFTAKRITSSTFAICESDAFKEHPLIYLKVVPGAPLIVLSDTGCNQPDKEHAHDHYVHLRDYIENCAVKVNNDSPFNPGGIRQYYIICTHCHYDHVGGIEQFIEGDTTEIIASAAGRDFIESDLRTNGLFDMVGKEPPKYQVTHWASAFERLKWPFQHPGQPKPAQTDLGITIIHTPGHTPDELAWYDNKEMHLSCGDSFYEEGEDRMPIQFPSQGSLIEWVFSMQKLAVFVRSENERARNLAKANEKKSDASFAHAPNRVKVSCAHSTSIADGDEILGYLENFAARAFAGLVPVAERRVVGGEICALWRDRYDGKLSIEAPERLMRDARAFFNIDVENGDFSEALRFAEFIYSGAGAQVGASR